MSIKPGTRFGAYEINGPLGAGGMGEVYKATDTRLNRPVAIKILPYGLPANPELRSRLQREAQMIAALNHPHICVLYDIGLHEGADYLVMEYLDGESLADRLNRGPLPLDQALEYAAQIADALDKAHLQGIVHRDLKPGNIMLTKSGAKVLDFGLAKVSPRVALNAAANSQAPTGNSALPLTSEGTILGTLHYMSPEQLEGKDADSRSDVFSFGAVLYEMVTGKRAFDGQSQASLIAAIMEREPAREALAERNAPAALERTLRKCMAKNPAKRWQSAGDLRDQIQWIKEHPADAPARESASSGRRELVAWSIAALLVIAVAVLAYRITHLPEVDQPVVRFPIEEPDGASFPLGPVGSSPAVSWDGRQIAFLAGGKLWVRNIDTMNARVLPGTESQPGVPPSPFWSPDGRYLAFFAPGKLMKIDVTGGSPQTLCPASSAAEGGAWSPDGNSILFVPSTNSAVYIVSAAGGEPKAVTTLKPGETHKTPSFLPDGKHFTYFSRPGNSVFVASIDGGAPKEILKADSKVIFSPPGLLLFVKEQTLFAQQFDPDKLAVIGTPTPIAEEIGVNTNNGRASFSVSWNGVLVFRTGGISSRKQLSWRDRTGKELGKVEEVADYRGISLSPDGTRLATHIHDDRDQGGVIWILDLVRGGKSRFTSKPHSTDPVWSPDGKQIAFDLNLNSSWQIYQKSSDGTGEEKVIYSGNGGGDMDTQGWSADGKLMFDVIAPSTKRDLWILPTNGDQKAFAFVNSEFNEQMGQVSPDGRWVAYESDETGRYEIYIQPYDRSGGKYSVSTAGGNQPIWNRNGKELFFFDTAGTLMSATIAPSAGALRVDVPKSLFKAKLAENLSARYSYAVAPDGQRFLIDSPVETETAKSAPMTVVLNWTKLLKH